MDDGAEPRHLGGQGAPAGRREAVVDATVIRLVLWWTGGDDVSVVFERAQVAVHRAGLDVDGALAQVEDVLPDAVAVSLAAGEDREYEQFIYRHIAYRHTIRLGGSLTVIPSEARD